MDSLGPAILIAILLVVGYVLGIVAFFRSLRLEREIARLRLPVQSQSGSESPHATISPGTVPPPHIEPSIDVEPTRAPQSFEETLLPAAAIHTPTTWSAPPKTAQSTSPSEKAKPAGTDIETIIGGKWLNVIGLGALFLATAFFLKYAFDNNWIGPAGRIAIGLIAGAGLLMGSEPILRRGWTYFSEGVAGLGAAILYLSLYASWNFYHLVPTTAAFIGMAVVTAALIGLAVGRDSQRIAILAMLGGFATPLLVATGQDAHVQLFTYLAVLNAGLISMALVRDWRAMPASFLFTLIYGAVWYSSFYDPTKLTSSMVFATVFFVEFAALPAILARRSGELRPDSVALALLNAAWYLMAVDLLLYNAHRWLLVAWLLALAVFFITLAQLAPRPKAVGKENVAARPIFGTLALAAATAAIPVRLEGRWIATAGAIEGALVVWTGMRANVRWLRGEGLVILGLVAFYMLVNPIPANTAFLNGRFLTFAVFVAALASVSILERVYSSRIAADERLVYRVAGVAANIYAVWSISVEIVQWLGTGPSATIGSNQELGLSMFWAIYAAGLAIAGFISDSRLVRGQAIALMTIVLALAPAFDLTIYAGPVHAFANGRFLACGVVFVALAITLVLSRRFETLLSETELIVFKAFEVALNVFAVWALSVQLWMAYAPANQSVFTGTEAQQLSLSVLWAAYAAVLSLIGVRRDSSLVRWQALILFALVILKAAFFDLSNLATGYRIASFFALGVMLVGASYLYQRRLSAKKEVSP